jgi:hypothetical protein
MSNVRCKMYFDRLMPEYSYYDEQYGDCNDNPECPLQYASEDGGSRFVVGIPGQARNEGTRGLVGFFLGDAVALEERRIVCCYCVVVGFLYAVASA